MAAFPSLSPESQELEARSRIAHRFSHARSDVVRKSVPFWMRIGSMPDQVGLFDSNSNSAAAGVVVLGLDRA